MPRPLHVCKQRDCSAVTTDTFCPAHKADARRQVRRFQQGLTAYNSARWMRIRNAFRETHPFCVNDGKVEGCTCLTDVVDHVLPHEGQADLMFDESNLQPMCWSCHSRKTAGEVQRRGRVQ